MQNLVNQVLQTNAELPQLIGNPREAFIGYVYRMRFDECLVVTNDKWKHDVNGIPHNSFLVAAGFNPEQMGGANEIDQEVVLLRVLEPSNLPQEADFVKTIIETHQRRTADNMMPGDGADGLDPITAAELQYGALRCRVLGTFYMENGELRLGSDIENFMTLSRLRAYKPRGAALHKIVNHVNPEVKKKSEEEAVKSGFKRAPAPINIGSIRYTSSARLHRGPNEAKVEVLIHPSDFLARRTAVFGMTRTGKSNMVKTTVSAVALAALEGEIKVGQLVFDVNGEYANANHQDGNSSIADVFGASRVVRYRAMKTDGFEDLRINFYQNCDQALNLLQLLWRSETSKMYSGQDLDTFMDSSLDEPDSTDRGAMNRFKVLQGAFQCLVYRAGYPPPDGQTIYVPRSQSLLTQLKGWAAGAGVTLNIPAQDQVTPGEACEWYEIIRTANLEIRDARPPGSAKIGLESSTRGKAWVDNSLEAYINMLARENSRRGPFGGYRVLVNYTDYHSATRTGEVAAEIIGHLDQGKIVILDLSVGPVEIRTVLSEKIATQIFTRQMGKMNRGEVPENVVLYVEEAHNLIGKDTELTTIWPRIAKEGAKAKIAFVYATQEPSSVHPNILSNTENWFVTHLNNDDELKTLSKFYDFVDFIKSLKMAQDVGFARMKSMSSPFVIPTQINKFEPDAIKLKIAAIEAAAHTGG